MYSKQAGVRFLNLPSCMPCVLLVSDTQALVSGIFFLPRYYIYYKVRNRSFVKNLGHRDFRVFSTRRTQAWRNGLHHLKLR